MAETSIEPAGTDHIVVGRERGWAWWKPVAIRSAGFPASLVTRLAVPELAASADTLNRSSTCPDARSLTAFRAEYADTLLALDHTIQAIARSETFQEALAWQNPRTLETAIDPVLRWDPARRNHKRREQEEFVASYLQRYCAKNDTIGFFGPIAWGVLAPERRATRVAVGPSLVASCSVEFEAWAIEALAAALNEDTALRQWLPPRRVPYVGLRGRTVWLPLKEPVHVSVAEAAILRACDGIIRARDIYAVVVGVPGVVDEADVYAILEALVARRWVAWRVEVPVGPAPEDSLLEVLSGVGDVEVRDAALEKLGKLVKARDRLASANRVASVRSAWNELNRTFTAVTGAAPSRHEGQTYAARTIAYRDCLRDVTVELGSAFVEELSPLTLLLQSARWFTFTVASEIHRRLLATYRALGGGEDTGVPLSTFWFECMPLLHKDAIPFVDDVEAELQRRWEYVLRPPSAGGPASYLAAELRPAVEAAFRAPHAGWAGARYCSPDVLVAATDAAAIDAGRFRLVLGELHVAINTLRTANMVAHHPKSSVLFRCLEQDFPEPRLVPVLPKEAPPLLTARLQPALERVDDLHVALFTQTADIRRQRVLLSADLSVQKRHGQLGVAADGRFYSVLDVFSELLTGLVANRFHMFPPRPHRMRIEIDRLVIAREAWEFAADAVTFAREQDEAARFAAARAWRSAHEMPQHVFVKSSLEQKPFLVDFDSPILVNLLAKEARRLQRETGRLSAEELLPKLDDLWLTDASGARYTSEIRLVAVDSRSP